MKNWQTVSVNRNQVHSILSGVQTQENHSAIYTPLLTAILPFIFLSITYLEDVLFISFLYSMTESKDQPEVVYTFQYIRVYIKLIYLSLSLVLWIVILSNCEDNLCVLLLRESHCSNKECICYFSLFTTLACSSSVGVLNWGKENTHKWSFIHFPQFLENVSLDQQRSREWTWWYAGILIYGFVSAMADALKSAWTANQAKLNISTRLFVLRILSVWSSCLIK